MGVDPASRSPLAKPVDPFNRGTLAIAPTDVDSEHNTIREPLTPIAGWELADVHFAFDSSVLLPSMTADLASFIVLVRANPGCPVAIFGHADPTGEDGYNKLLSGRRATALYALLTRRVDLWEHLHTNPMGRDDWKKNELAVTVMRRLLDDKDGSGSRLSGNALFRSFMDAVSVDEAGKGFEVPAKGFLGQGEDKAGKADYQGCGEFNPLVMFSTREAADFAAPSRKEDRDDANAPNRRVTAFLFPKETRITVAKWPCPRVNEGVGGCRKRFWSDAPVRRTNQELRREHPKDNDTFACRFYDRLVRALDHGPAVRPLVLRLLNEREQPDGGVAFTLVSGDLTTTGTTTAEGMIRAKVPARARTATLMVRGDQIPITIAPLPPIATVAGVQVRLANLGFFGGQVDGVAGFQTREAVSSFEKHVRDEGRDIPITGDPNNPVMQAALLKEHGS